MIKGEYKTSSSILSLLLAAVFVFTSLAVPNLATAGSAISATSSFKSPKGCKNSRALAKAFKAVQACEQRFSPTHEFVLILLEKRYRSKATTDAAKAKSVKSTVRKYTSDLRKANSNAAGQKLEFFESSESLWSCRVCVPASQLIMRPFVQKPRGFCRRAMSGDGAGYKSH